MRGGPEGRGVHRGRRRLHGRRNRRIERLRSGCESALGCDEGCLDARAILALTEKGEPDDALERLEEIERGLESMEPVDGADLWEDAFARPRLRLLASIARARLETARYRPALATCESVAALNPTDELGARHTWAIALARLEDEAAFDELDARFGRQGNAWTHLTRALLLFKLDRMPAARRALRGFASLCRGGAYALLRPTFVEPVPARPARRRARQLRGGHDGGPRMRPGHHGHARLPWVGKRPERLCRAGPALRARE